MVKGPDKWPAGEKIAYQLQNPKKPGGQAYERYEKYKHSKTVQEALDRGAAPGDLVHDFSRGLMWKQSKANPNAMAYTVSLGTRCITAEVLRDVGLRRFSCPFDWVYSSAEMVSHCLKDNFKTFLDQSQFVKSKGGALWGHKLYCKMLNRSVIFPHHNPRAERADFLRRVKRFQAVLKSSRRKLFVMCSVVESQSGLQEEQDSKGKEFHNAFKALLKRPCSNFELLCINVICGKPGKSNPSEAKSKPIIKKTNWGCKSGRNSLVIYNFHCAGECTGLRLKKKQDREHLAQLVTAGHSFDLADDPVPADTTSKHASGIAKKRPASQSSSFFKLRQSVKRTKDGHWRMKSMD